jgi:ABC-2 type transport system permease protein
MHKIWLVTQREYITRVRNKAFLLTTFLTPLGILVFLGAVALVMNTGSDEQKKISVYDPSGLLEKKLEVRENLSFSFNDQDLQALLNTYKEGKTDGVLEVPALKDSLASNFSFTYHADDQLAMDESSALKDAIEDKIRQYKLIKLKIDTTALKGLDTDVRLIPQTINAEKEVSSITVVVSSVLGGIVGYAMFFIILLYGMQVMRSVMEEKINRIIEVLISSLRPFDLLMGKVIGVGLVGLTQICIWLLIIPVVMLIGNYFFGTDAQSAAMGGQQEMADAMMTELSSKEKIGQILLELQRMNWYLILPLTLFYFLAGYFAYSALFAAIGSAVGEDINEASSLTFPVMLPLMFSMYIGLSAISAPDSSLAVWASMIPLLSSIVMPVRLPFDPPWWQVIISVVSLIAFTIFVVWIAARIYRVGILMYGKKATLKEVGKWLFYKE